MDRRAGRLRSRALARLAGLLGAPLRPASTPALKPAGAIVILGAPLRADGSLGPLAEERVRVGATLYARGLAPLVVVTGGHCPDRGHPAEAEGMARSVRALGVPEAALRIDRKAASTRESAARTAEILAAEGVRRVWLVTQPFHLRRACFYFRRAGLDPLPFRIDGGLEERAPALAVRWIAREYGAWALALARAGWASARRAWPGAA